MDKYGDDAHHLGEVEGTRGEGLIDREEGGGKISNFIVCVIIQWSL